MDIDRLSEAKITVIQLYRALENPETVWRAASLLTKLSNFSHELVFLVSMSDDRLTEYINWVRRQTLITVQDAFVTFAWKKELLIFGSPVVLDDTTPVALIERRDDGRFKVITYDHVPFVMLGGDKLILGPVSS